MAKAPDPFFIDDDNPELDAETFATMRPAEEVLPRGLFERLTRGQTAPKVSVTLELDRDLVERFRASGPDWRKNINDALRKASGC